MAQYVSGLSGSGLDVSGIVNSLMAVERLPQQRLVQQRTAATSRAAAWGDLVTRVGALQTNASALSRLDDVRKPAVTSSATGVLAATAGGVGTAVPGTLSLRVLSLATSGRLASAPVADPDTAVVSTATRAVVASGTGLGLAGWRASAAATAGEHTVEVTRGSEPARLTAGTAVPRSFASPTTVTFTLDDGRVLSSTLSGDFASADAVRARLQADLGDAVTVELDDIGALSVRTAADGAARSLTVGGAGAETLGFSGGDVAAGEDGWVSVDGGTEEQVAPGSTVTSASGLTLTAGARLTAGTATAHVLDLEAGTTLRALATRLNEAGLPATASVVSTDGSSRLVLTAAQTGAASGVSFSVDEPGGLTFTSIQDPRDAVLAMGSLRLTRPSNTVTDLVAGVTLSLAKADPDTDVSVTVSPDTDGLITKIKAMVDQVNQTAASVKTKTRYDVATGTGGPLVGENAARDLVTRINAALTAVPGVDDLPGVSALGIRAQRDGTWSFDEAAFRTVLQDRPEAAAQLLAATGTALADVAKAVTQTGGVLKTRQDSETESAKRLTDAASAWDARLSAVEDRYRKQFSRLEGVLGSLRTQSGFLAGQIGALPSWQS